MDHRITAVVFGLPVSIDELSTYHLAGGNVPMAVLACAFRAGQLGFVH